MGPPCARAGLLTGFGLASGAGIACRMLSVFVSLRPCVRWAVSCWEPVGVPGRPAVHAAAEVLGRLPAVRRSASQGAIPFGCRLSGSSFSGGQS